MDGEEDVCVDAEGFHFISPVVGVFRGENGVYWWEWQGREGVVEFDPTHEPFITHAELFVKTLRSIIIYERSVRPEKTFQSTIRSSWRLWRLQI
jgi:hypothetical protein